MGAQRKQASRVAAARKMGQVVGKLVREIMIAAKLGGPVPSPNRDRLGAKKEGRVETRPSW